MFKISGEAIFIGDGSIGGGMKMSDELREKGFDVTPLLIFNEDPKRYRFTFNCCSGEDK